jgi:hypothetical protein
MLDQGAQRIAVGRDQHPLAALERGGHIAANGGAPAHFYQ